MRNSRDRGLGSGQKTWRGGEDGSCGGPEGEQKGLWGAPSPAADNHWLVHQREQNGVAKPLGWLVQFGLQHRDEVRH